MRTSKPKFAGSALLVFCAGTLVSALTAKGWAPIGVREIANALASTGVHVVPDQIEPLSSVPSSKPNPKLKVIRITPLENDSATARLECENTRVCLPFYVLVRWQKSDDADSALAAWKQSASAAPHRLKKEEVLVHSGKDATLIFESRNVRMTLPVLCLQSGSRGQRVRVMSKDRKRVYLARVAGEATLRAGMGD